MTSLFLTENSSFNFNPSYNNVAPLNFYISAELQRGQIITHNREARGLMHIIEFLTVFLICFILSMSLPFN